MSVDSDYYAVLGIPADAASPVIREAYRSSMRKCHPDLNRNDDAAARARIVNEAYRILRDPQTRATYDEDRTRRGRPARDRPTLHAGFASPFSRHQDLQLQPAPGPAPRSLWLPFTLFVVSAIGGFLGLLSSGILNPASSAYSGRALDEEERGNKRIDDLIAAMVDGRDEAAPKSTPTSESGPLGSRAGQLGENLESPPVASSDIAYAAGKFAEVSLRSGMRGAQNYSVGCHEEMKARPSWKLADRCSAFDLTARIVDADVARSTRSQADDYFISLANGGNGIYSFLGASTNERSLREPQIIRAILPIIRPRHKAPLGNDPSRLGSAQSVSEDLAP
jgi:curved DNA-binding protein CbpA